MRNLILSCVFLTTLSCYSYKNVDSNNFHVDKEYKITMSNGITSEVKVIGVRQDSLVIQQKDIQSIIPKNGIIRSKQRKFSYVQTSGLILGAVGGPLVLLAAIMSGSVK